MRNKDAKKLEDRLCIYRGAFFDNIAKEISGKEVICFNAASAGEFNAIKKLLQQIDHSDRFIVVMTATSSGATAFDQYEHPSKNICHVYTPLDAPMVVQKFLDFWQPQALLLVESEIWPNLIKQTAEIASVSIINARMSEKSFRKWMKAKAILEHVLSYCCFIGASTERDLSHYKTFYPRTILTGNLKYDSERLAVNSVAKAKLQESVEDRPLIVCASTHAGEEEILIEAYHELTKTIPNLLMIIAPRHIERGENIAKLCFKNQLIAVLRSTDKMINNHIPREANVYVANTMGELGLFFSLSQIVFMGGSLVDVGGHNMCEPARFECSILTGPYTYNFSDLVKDMKIKDALIVIKNKQELIEAVRALIKNPGKAAEIGEKGLAVVQANVGALKMTVDCLKRSHII